MELETFVAVHEAPPGLTQEELNALLERVSSAADKAGVHPVESLYLPDAGEVITLVKAASAEDVAAVHDAAGVSCGRIGRATRVYTELLTQDRRDSIRSD